MPKKIDGVSIAVKDESQDNFGPKKRKTKVTKKNNSLRKKEEDSANENSFASEDSTATEKRSSVSCGKKNDNNSLKIFLSILITAMIVGGSIFTWQEGTKEKEVKQVKEQTEEVKSVFEKEVGFLKNKLLGIESENKELKEVKKVLEDKTDLLTTAKIDYKNEELGFAFTYPAVYGQVKLEIEEGVSGSKFKGSFSEYKNLVFSGLSHDYTASSSFNFLNSFGFREDKNKFYYRGLEEELEIEPIKIVDDKFPILILDSYSFIKTEIEDDILENENVVAVNPELKESQLGALVNLQNENYAGLIWLHDDKNNFSLDEFGEFLNSIEYINN